jgi:choline monooxygenase
MVNFDAMLPLAKARTLPAECYREAAYTARERDRIFSNTWQYVGRTEQVERGGQYLTADIAGEPVLVVRGDDGTLRGFFNVCRHRAAPLCTEPCGTATKLRCHYHGWTYDLAGHLHGTPEFDGVQDFDKTQNGLTPLAVETFGPFVFAHLGTPQLSLTQYLEPMPVWCQDRDAFHDMIWHRQIVYDVDCNWKVYVDNYLDGGYHINTVHPALAGVINYRDYTTTTHTYAALQSSPLKAADTEAGRTRTGTEAGYWWAFPNFMLNWYQGVMDTNVVRPLGTERCQVLFDFWFANGTDESFINDSIRVADQVQLEDMLISAQVQRGLNSRSYSTGRFSVRRENAAHFFHQLVSSSLGD